MKSERFVMGAVAYDPKVVTIWEGFKAYFQAREFPFDYVLFSNYEHQVEACLAGEIDVAWNSPLAWVRSRRMAEDRGQKVRALAMRDTDRDLTSVIVVREDSAMEATGDLKGAVVSVGAIDSPQATLIPLGHLMAEGLRPDGDFRLVYQDLRGGKHGDHGAAERAAARALVAGEVDAASLLGGNQLLFAAEGVIPNEALRVIGETERFDHCNFTAGPHAPDAATDRFQSLLLEMRYEDPEVRPLFDLEGLRAWVEGRTEGYEVLESAVDEVGFYDSAGAITLEAYRY